MVRQSLTYGLDPGSRPVRHRKKCGNGYPLFPKANLKNYEYAIRNGLITDPPLVAHSLRHSGIF